MRWGLVGGLYRNGKGLFCFVFWRDEGQTGVVTLDKYLMEQGYVWWRLVSLEEFDEGWAAELCVRLSVRNE